MPTILSLGSLPANDPRTVYVGDGRDGWPASPLANRFRVGKLVAAPELFGDAKEDDDRVCAHNAADALNLYRAWLWAKIKEQNKDVLDALSEIREDSVIACGCDPDHGCHCEVVVRAWKWLQAQSKES